MVSFCLGWGRKWLRLVSVDFHLVAMPARAPARRRVARLQGSRGGVGEGGAGRAKSFWETGMRDEMLVSLLKVSSVSRPKSWREEEMLDAAKVMKPRSELNLRGDAGL